jgi:hypothetical protein
MRNVKQIRRFANAAFIIENTENVHRDKCRTAAHAEP